MRDQMELAQECIQVEVAGGNVIDYLKNRGFISPKATWERLQLNYLGRTEKNMTKGLGDRMATKITLEQKKKAVEIALLGLDPIAYLDGCGSKNPRGMWNSIKMNLKQKEPATYAKLPDFRTKGAKQVVDVQVEEPEESGKQFFTLDVEEPDPEEAEPRTIMVKTVGPEPEIPMIKPENIKAPVDKKDVIYARSITKPVNYDGFDVCAVNGIFGRYSARMVNGRQWIDFDDPSGDTLSFEVDAWREFLKELKRAAAVLGVEL